MIRYGSDKNEYRDTDNASSDARSLAALERELLAGTDSFETAVYDVVRRIPSGHVATYGQIARLSGHPGAARAVGNALHHNPDPDHIPCFRVVNAAGKLTGSFAFGGIYVQRDLLEEDGVEVINLSVNLKKYQWDGINETEK